MTLPDQDRGGVETMRHSTVFVPLWLLTMITFSGTLAMYIFVPALASAAVDLNASAASMQLTVSVYILGLAVGQLIYGPVSDRFGRKPVLIGGLLIYSLAGVAAALASSVDALIVARLFQALGGCSGLVMGRTIIRDTSVSREAVRRLALLNFAVGLGPGTAPLIGGLMSGVLGWRTIFYVLVALGVANLLFAWRLLPETGPVNSNTSARVLARHYGQLVSAPAFLGYAIGGGFATCAWYGFIAAAPFIYVHQLHRAEYEVGIYLFAMIAASMVASITTSRLIGRISIDRLMVSASLVGLVAAFTLLGLVLTDHVTVLGVTLTAGAFVFSTGMSGPTASTQAISVKPEVIGSAAGLYGFTQMLIGALCSALVTLGSDPTLAVAIVLASSGVLAQTGFWIAIYNRRQARKR